MKTILALLLLFLFSNQLYAYPGKSSIQSTIEQLNTGNQKDLKLITDLYLDCTSSDEALAFMHELEKQLPSSALTSLNRIASASRISFWGDHSLALKQLKQLSASIHAQSKYVKGEYYNILGKISYRSENPRTAIQHYEKSITYLKQAAEPVALQSAYTNLGLAYGAIDQHEKALTYYNEAENVTDQTSAKTQLYIELNKALSLTNLGKHAESKRAFMNALSYIKETKDYFAEVRTYGNLADIYVLEDSLEKAEDFLLKGRKLAVEHRFKLDLIRFDLTLAKVYKSKGEFEKAFLYLESHDSIRNNVHIEKAAEDVMQLEKINQAAIDRLKQEALQETIQLKKQKNWILWGAVGILSILILILTQQFLAIRLKNKVLLKQQQVDTNSSSSTESEPKNESISKETIELIRSFEKLLIDQGAFSKSDLTQDKVAKKLNTNRTYLSKAINDYYKMSYSRWLNELRVTESKKMLVDPKYKHYSIEGIATSVGFSSLSTFNSNFKSITGLTPSYFRKNHKTN